MNRPIKFRGGASFLSNFYVCTIHVWYREFNTVESAYQWRICMHHGDLETADKMLTTRTDLHAKYLSKSIREKVHLRAEWNKKRYSVMYALVAVTFRDPTLRKRLLDTRESELKEWVNSREGYWSALTYSGQAGQNMLGQILMRAREFIRMHQNPPTAKRWSDVTRVDRTIGQSTMHRKTPGEQ